MSRKKRAEKPKYSVSFDINGKTIVLNGGSLFECLSQLDYESFKSMVFKTKLLMTLRREEKTASQQLNRLMFRRLCINKINKEIWARNFERLVA